VTLRSASAVGERRSRFRARQDRIRDPSLTVLLILELSYMFAAAPLAAKGVPFAWAVGETLVLAVLVIVVLLSHRRGAFLIILLGAAGTLAGLAPALDWPTGSLALGRGGNILMFSALTWVVAHSVYAPGRITSHRLQGAVVVYLNIAAIFASAYRLIWEFAPGAFAGPSAPTGGPSELAAALYFSFTTLTTTGYGDIVPLDPFARSLANLEAVIGQFYLAITVARLVTLELASRHRGLSE
jgi:hypothetical protein